MSIRKQVICILGDDDLRHISSPSRQMKRTNKQYMWAKIITSRVWWPGRPPAADSSSLIAQFSVSEHRNMSGGSRTHSASSTAWMGTDHTMDDRGNGD